MNFVARPVRLRHTKEWGASVPNTTVAAGHLIVIQTRSGRRRLAQVRAVVSRVAGGETIVSLSSPGALIPSPKKAT